MRCFVIASVLFTAAVAVFANPVVERQNPPSIAVILAGLNLTLTPLANHMGDLALTLNNTPSNATVDGELWNVTTQINTIVISAANNMTLLLKQSANVTMASVNGTTILTASDIANLFAHVFNVRSSNLTTTWPFKNSLDYHE